MEEKKNTLWTKIAVALKKHAPSLVSEIETLFAEQNQPATPPVQATLAELKTKEGKVFSVEGELGPGAPVFVTNEAGEKMPVPDGEYPLEDGSILKVVGGLITEIAAVEAPPTQMSKEEAEQMILGALKERDDKISALTTELEAVKKQNAVFAKLATAIVETPVEDEPAVVKSYTQLSALERYELEHPL